MDVEHKILGAGKENHNTRFISYLKTVCLQLDLLRTKSSLMNNEEMIQDVAALEHQKRHLVERIADFIEKTGFQMAEVTQIEKGYELLLRQIAVTSLRD